MSTNSKFYIFLFIGIVAVFAGILSLTQQDFIKRSLLQESTIPTLPPAADTLQLIQHPTATQQQQGQQVQDASSQQQVQPTWGVEEGVKASYSATIKTAKGDIVVTLRGDMAPKTVRNFLNKIQSHFYAGLIFHRVEDWVIQGGDPKGDGTGGGEILTETNNLPFTAGSLGMARGQDARISNDSQFFITKTDASWLNGQYTNFGQVTSGMDVVNSIQKGDKILEIMVDQ